MPQETQVSNTGLVWFRQSLRLRDHAPLYHALRENESVRCVYVLDDRYFRSPDMGAARAAFLFTSLSELSEALEAHGGQLILRRSTEDSAAEVVKVAKEVGAGRIYKNDDYYPFAIQRDERVTELAAAEHIEVKSFQDLLLVDPARVLTENDAPYTVFTPFKRKWEALLNTPGRYEYDDLLPRLKQTKPCTAVPVPTLADFGFTLKQDIFAPGERAAYARLETFLRDGLPAYHQNRDNCAAPDSTSRLSMHLKWGTVSVRDCYREARRIGGPGADKWIDELAWREFFYAVIYHFPNNLTGPMYKEYGDFPWVDNAEHLEAWKAGMTGYPLVDAGMRQMNTTGWMHNRTRQVVASYLCKDLVINWQEGEKYFMQMLACGDWAPNNGGWQWVAGTGTDPRRATRIFNPTLQLERYDPKAEYVRQWVPEYGTAKYPQPIVPHEVGRAEFMRRFGQTAAGREAIRAERREAAAQAKAGRRRGGKGGDGQKGLF